MSTDTTEVTSTTSQPPSPGTESMPSGRRWLVIALSVAMVAAAVAGITLRGPDRADAMVFRYVFTPGESRVYDMSMAMQMRPSGMPEAPGMEVNATATTTMTAVEVHEDGTTVFEVTTEGLEMTGMPGAMPPEEPGTVRMTVAADGRLLGIDGEGLPFTMPTMPGPMAGGGSPTDSAGPQMMFPQFPDEAVLPGDTWSKTYDVPTMSDDQTMTVTVNGRHEGFEETAFGRAARLHHRSDIPLDLEMSMAEMLGNFTEGMPGLGGPGSGPAPGFADARMAFRGTIAMEGTSLVLPEPGNVVSIDTAMDMTMDFEFIGFPVMDGSPAQGFGTHMTMHLQMTRVS